jgi:hypothetical protein
MKVSRRSVLKGAAGIAAAGVGSSILGRNIADAKSPTTYVADVVICGAGSAGLAAAVRARELGLSVVVIEAQSRFGGRGIVNSGNIPIGGGSPAQMLAGLADTPDILYRDLTDWTIVQANGFPSYRYNDHEVIRGHANYNTGLQDFLSRNGVVFTRTTPDNVGGNEVGNSFNRMMHSAILKYESARSGLVGSGSGATTSEGPGFIYPLYNSAVAKGATIILNCRLLTLDQRRDGGVEGITASYNGDTIKIEALKGVLIATGGGQGNVNYRQMFDPRLGPEYISVAGEPWSFQDASGIFSGLNAGGALAGAYNHMAEIGTNVTKAGKVGTQHNYTFLNWGLQSKPFLEGKVKATGFTVNNFQDGILIKAKPGNDQLEVSVRGARILAQITQPGGPEFEQSLGVDDQTRYTPRVDLEEFGRRLDSLDQRDVSHLPATVRQVNRERSFAGARYTYQYDVRLGQVPGLLAVVMLDRELYRFDAAEILIVDTVQQSRCLTRRTAEKAGELQQQGSDQIEAGQSQGVAFVMNQLRQLPVDDGVDDKSLLVQCLVQRLIHLVFAPHVADPFHAHRLVAELGQGGRDDFFRGFTGSVGKQVDYLRGEHVLSS